MDNTVLAGLLDPRARPGSATARAPEPPARLSVRMYHRIRVTGRQLQPWLDSPGLVTSTTGSNHLPASEPRRRRVTVLARTSTDSEPRIEPGGRAAGRAGPGPTGNRGRGGRKPWLPSRRGRGQ